MRIWLFLAGIFMLLGCGQAHPLSITLMDPKTKTLKTCSARKFGAADVPVLSRAVQACAEQLEAQGFVRVE
jgi:hypothetical protein